MEGRARQQEIEVTVRQIRRMADPLRGQPGNTPLLLRTDRDDREIGTVHLENPSTGQEWTIDIDGELIERRPL